MANPEFEFCQALVENIRDQITSNSAEAEVKELMLGIARNQGSFSDQRTAFVNENASEIYAFITDGMDTQAICHALGVAP
ncbi:saposin domain-containing protein [Nocardia suismassiliense]|uniref:saposin domain-containing protein n=1 Tax=Nocardia suismassiliense TaxID=2077092 RepID=UPI000D1DF84A|nr:saposin domain-containing protein [Nocardia suismassiliense]